MLDQGAYAGRASGFQSLLYAMIDLASKLEVKLC